jgi:hypothetical protein
MSAAALKDKHLNGSTFDLCAKIIIVLVDGSGDIDLWAQIVPSDNYFALIKPDCRRADGDFLTRSAKGEKQN